MCKGSIWDDGSMTYDQALTKHFRDACVWSYPIDQLCFEELIHPPGNPKKPYEWFLWRGYAGH